jgi:hypothetical protein
MGVVGILAGGCGREENVSSKGEQAVAQPSAVDGGGVDGGADAGLTQLNTFISDFIQIDQLGSGLAADDANLFLGPDPADGTASVDKPGPGGQTLTTIN